jgi:LysM repeat protein
MKQQNLYGGGGGLNQRTDYSAANAYDKVGNLLNYNVGVYVGTSYTNYYTYTYTKFDDYKEVKVAGSSTYFQPGETNTSYDVNGHISTVIDTQQQWVADGEYGYYAQQPTRTRSFIGDADGTILRKTDNGNVQNLYYAGDKAVGSVAGTAASPVADFDFNYAPVSDSFPAVSPGNYTVVSGDTLRGIAYKAYGDAKLWYLIADANGLMTDGDMHVGQALKIPNRITNVHNDFQTNHVYNAADIIGDITPTLPDPPPPPQSSGGDGGCGGFGSVLIMVVAIVATALTAGAAGQSIVIANAAAEGIAAEVALSVYSAGELAAVGMANPLTAGLSYAAGNLAGQVTGNLAGVQDGINFGQIASAGLSGALGSVFADTVGTQALKGAGIDNPSLQTAVSYGARSILNQGINLLTGQQQSFDWRQVATAAISAPLVNLALSGVKGADAGSRMAQTVIGDVVRQSVSSMFYAGGRVNFANIASGAFGDTLGTALSIASFEKASQQEEKLEVSGLGQFKVPGVLLGDLNPSKYQLLAQNSVGSPTVLPDVVVYGNRYAEDGDASPRRVNDQQGTMRQFFMLDDLHLDQRLVTKFGAGTAGAILRADAILRMPGMPGQQTEMRAWDPSATRASDASRNLRISGFAAALGIGNSLGASPLATYGYALTKVLGGSNEAASSFALAGAEAGNALIAPRGTSATILSTRRPGELVGAVQVGQGSGAKSVAIESRVPSQLLRGQAVEAEQLALQGGGDFRKSLYRPSVEDININLFRQIVGEPKYTPSGLLRGTYPDFEDAFVVQEIKSGGSDLRDNYQMRLQLYKATSEGKNYMVNTSRPIEPGFADYLKQNGAIIKPLKSN